MKGISHETTDQLQEEAVSAVAHPRLVRFFSLLGGEARSRGSKIDAIQPTVVLDICCHASRVDVVSDRCAHKVEPRY